MTDVIHGKRKAEIQVITDSDPNNLRSNTACWHSEQQDAGNCKQGAGDQNPGAGFSLTAACPLHDLTHYHVRYGVNDL